MCNGSALAVVRLCPVDGRHALLPLSCARGFEVALSGGDSRVTCIFLGSAQIDLAANPRNVRPTEFVQFPRFAVRIPRTAMTTTTAPETMKICEPLQMPNHPKVRLALCSLNDQRLARMVLLPLA